MSASQPRIPDTPQRIATDTSQKLPVRYGGTLRRYRERSLPMVQLRYIPLVFAGWCRYLLGVDDAGKTMPVSPDPLLPQLQPLLADVTPRKARYLHPSAASHPAKRRYLRCGPV